jgi:DNA (cytosine-5)-methyltransferase 1
MIGIDLFAGSGGLSCGAEQAGIKITYAVENNPYAAMTYSKNHKRVNLIPNDIRSIKKLKLKRKEPLIVFGGPPCQGFSTSNRKTRKKDNESNWLFEEFLRIVKLCKSEWVLIENVKGLTDTEDGFFFDKITGELQKMKYAVSSWVLNAVDYGVPQFRSRCFIIGSIDGIYINYPTPTAPKHVTVHEAIHDLPILENGSMAFRLPYKSSAKSNYAKEIRADKKTSTNHFVTQNAPHILERYNYVPQGGNWENIPKHLMENYKNVENCHTGIYHRLDENKPSIVIGNYRKNMLIHPTENRGLSVREAARLQSFPDGYTFYGSIGFQQQQVGNAVPPKLAFRVFKNILEKNE